MSEPFFSVIIPTYNRASVIQKCLSSVLEQTFTDFEVLIIDNGSNDKTQEVLKTMMATDSRVQYFYQENTGSPAGSRNTGIKKAQAPWLAFLDSDDLWKPQKLQRVYDRIQEFPQCIAFSHWEDFIEGGKLKDVHKHGRDRLTYEDLLYRGNCLSTSAMTCRKDKVQELGGFNPSKELFSVEDYDLWLKLARKGPMYCLKENLGAFIVDQDNMSGRTEMHFENLKNLLALHITDEKKLKKHLARADYYKGRTYQKLGEFKQAQEILKKSIHDYPWAIKKWVSLTFALLKVRC